MCVIIFQAMQIFIQITYNITGKIVFTFRISLMINIFQQIVSSYMIGNTVLSIHLFKVVFIVVFFDYFSHFSFRSK